MTTDNDVPQIFHDEPADAEPYSSWFGWGAASDPAPSPASSDADYPAFGYRPESGYPQGAGFAPLPGDYPDLSGPGYRVGTGYPAQPDYAPEPDYRYDGWTAPEAGNSGYAEAGYGWDASAAGTADSLTAECCCPARRQPPGPGWRGRIFRVTGGLLRLGESAADIRRRDLINRVRTPVAGGHHRVAVLSLKGGVGKTTTAVGLGATLATLRGDRVIAVDANPDRGTLSDKVGWRPPRRSGTC